MSMRNFIGALVFRLARLAGGLAVAALGVAAIVPEASALTITTIENTRAGTATYLMSGNVEAGDAARLQRAAALLPSGTMVKVVLDSDGGDLIEGIRLGDLFHQAGMATFVASGGRCHSACALAFLGGRDPRTGEAMRIKPASAKLGFHQFRRGKLDPLKVYTKADLEAEIAETQRVTGEIVRYLQRIGDGLAKLGFMLRSPAETMNILSDEDCLAGGISVLDDGNGRLIEPGGLGPRVSSLGTFSGSLSGLAIAR